MIFNTTPHFNHWFGAGALTLLLAAPAQADRDGEREALARLVHELTIMEPLIREAEAEADPDARIRFQYDWLRQDLARIRLGIRDHINAPHSAPRPVQPLRGDYRR